MNIKHNLEKNVFIDEGYLKDNKIESKISKKNNTVCTKLPLFSVTHINEELFVVGGGSGSDKSGISTGIIFFSWSKFPLVVSSYDLSERIPMKVVFCSNNKSLYFSHDHELIVADMELNSDFNNIKFEKIEFVPKELKDQVSKQFCIGGRNVKSIFLEAKNNNILVYNQNEKNKFTFLGNIIPKYSIKNISTSPNGKILVIVYKNGKVGVFDTKSPFKELSKIKFKEFASNSHFIDDKNLLVLLNTNKTMVKNNKIILRSYYQNKEWKLKIEKLVINGSFGENITTNKNLITISTSSALIIVFDKKVNKLFKLKTYHNLPITDISLHENKDKLITVSADKTVKIFDLEWLQKSFRKDRFIINLFFSFLIIGIITSFFIMSSETRNKTLKNIYFFLIKIGFYFDQLLLLFRNRLKQVKKYLIKE